MRAIAIAILAIALTTAAGQTVGAYLKRNALSLSAMTLAGAADGLTEVIRYDYPAFKNRFPNANDQFWQPELSWRNKWKDGDPANGPAYFGSTTILVWTTDGYHLSRTLQKSFICAAIAFKIGDRKQKWYLYLIDFAAHSAAYSIGFNATLHGFFNHKF